MVGVESDADQIAQTIIIPVPDKTIHLIRHGVLAIYTYIDIFIIIEKFYPGRGLSDRPLIRDNLYETIRPFALLRPKVLIQLTVGYYRYAYKLSQKGRSNLAGLRTTTRFLKTRVESDIS